MTLHQWLGGVMGVMGVVAAGHLGADCPWLRAIFSRLPHAATGRPRVLVLGGSLCAGLGIALRSGTALSARVGFSTAAGPRTCVHIIAGLITLLLTSIETCLHWRWVVAAGRKWIGTPPQQAPAPIPAPTAGTQLRPDRRQFSRPTAIVGTACLLAGVPAWNEVRAQDASPGSEESSSARAPRGGTLSRAGSGMVGGHGDSNPGRRHRCCDADGDGWCDTGKGVPVDWDARLAGKRTLPQSPHGEQC